MVLITFTITNFPIISTVAQEQQYSFVTKWGSEGVGFGKFKQPLEIAIDSNNRVYVTDTTSVSNQLQKFTPSARQQ